ncbi:MAG: EAL domain-containing protein [Devosiaceae bacterium]|nr:EAL domain-containing protein [Devosiaceae bacterium MH13]
MNEGLSSLVRPLGPRDHLRFAELAAIHVCLDELTASGPPSAQQTLDALGENADHVTLSSAQSDGSYLYIHFGKAIVEEAGFDMTGKSTEGFDGPTRLHIENSFDQALESGIALCTIMPGSISSSVHSWQRVVFPVELDTGPHVVSMVRPLHRALDAIHGRRADVAVCVLPLKKSEDGSAFDLMTEKPLHGYLGPCDLQPLKAFVHGVDVPQQTPPVGTLIATFAQPLPLLTGGSVDVIADVVHGFTAPFLVVVNAAASTQSNNDLRSATHILRASFTVGRLGSWVKRSRDSDLLEIAPELGDLLGLHVPPGGRIRLSEMRAHYTGDLPERITEAVDACWDNGTEYVVEGQFQHPDGPLLDIRISGQPMRDQAGRVVNLFGIFQDITEQKAASRKLQESEARFRDFAGSAADWCWETDPEHKFLSFTDGLESIGHYAQGKFVGRTRRELPLIKEDQPLIEQHMEDLAAHREFKDLVYRLRDTDSGKVTTFQIAGKPRFDENGHFLGYRGTGRNITELVASQRENEERLIALRNAQSIAGLGHWITDLDTGRTRWSDGILHLFGFPSAGTGDPDKLSDAPGFNLSWLIRRVHRDDRHKVFEALRTTDKTNSTGLIDLRYTAEGRKNVKHMRIQLRYQPATTLFPPRLMGVAQDVSDLKSVQAELETRTEALNQAQAMGGIGDWQYDVQSGTITWSAQLFSILRLDPEGFVPTAESIASLCPPDDAAAIISEQAKVIKEGVESVIDVQARRGDGTIGYYSTVTKPTRDSAGRVSGMFGTVQDITDRKHAEKQLRTLAYFDPLTGLANRTLFTRELNDVFAAIIENGGSAALLLLDLDHFKEVNDTLGHAAGDELLGRIAHALREHVGTRGFVARLGGDEFAVIIRDYRSVSCLQQFANELVERLSGVTKLRRGEVVTGTSVGISLIPQDGGTAEEALRNADLALYMAKDDGRGKALFFEHAMSRSVQARLRLARDLREAVENNRLETRYQGQVELATGKVVGFETLLRWKHPVHGYISPSEFVLVAESSSLIGDIGLWVLRDACKTGAAWLRAGEARRVISVNVSAAQIWQGDFEEQALKIIEETGYPPELLCIELTENVFADHSEGRVRAALARFKEAGVRLALDDFGTGYSSLGYLNELPFEELKIDRCFIAGAHESPEKARLLEGIIALGKGLRMRVVGEGAEADGELQLLQSLGCDVVQGFAFMRPEIASDALRCADQVEFRLAEQASTQAEQQHKSGADPLKKVG